MLSIAVALALAALLVLAAWSVKRAAAQRARRALAAVLTGPVSDEEVLASIWSLPLHLAFSLLKDCKITRVSNSQSASTTDIDSSRVDMAGYTSVCFIAILGDVTTGSVMSLTAKSNAADSTSSSTTEKAGTTITAGASDYDNKLLVVDVIKPTLRYAYCSLAIDTANAVVDGIIAIQYGASNPPVTQGSTVGDGVLGGPNA